MAATRLPGKPLALINDEPMIVHVWKRACQSEAGPVIVACGDIEIKETIENAKKDAPKVVEEKINLEEKNKSEKPKTLQEIDREKLDKKFAKKENKKTN